MSYMIHCLRGKHLTDLLKHGECKISNIFFFFLNFCAPSLFHTFSLILTATLQEKWFQLRTAAERDWLSPCYTIKWERWDGIWSQVCLLPKELHLFTTSHETRQTEKWYSLSSKPKNVLWKHFSVLELLAIAALGHKERGWPGRGADRKSLVCKISFGLSLYDLVPFLLCHCLSLSTLHVPLSPWAHELVSPGVFFYFSENLNFVAKCA